MKVAPVLAACILLLAPVAAQRGNQPPPPAPRAGAPIDLTGYWVSIVTADWRWRMVTPAKGDYQGVQLNAEGRKAADAWDPEKDEAAGEQCKSYGAPALMSVPGRIHITWQDDTTLKVDTDAGTQTRLLRFPSAGSGQAAAPPIRPTGGSLEVVTTNLRAGYLRKNGVPYSENAVLTEHWDLYKRPNGEQWLTITTQIEDSRYLSNVRLIAPVFKKEPNGSKWDPTPCSSRW